MLLAVQMSHSSKVLNAVELKPQAKAQVLKCKGPLTGQSQAARKIGRHCSTANRQGGMEKPASSFTQRKLSARVAV